MERVIHSSKLDKYDINKYHYISFEGDGSDTFEPHPVFSQQNSAEQPRQHQNEESVSSIEHGSYQESHTFSYGKTSFFYSHSNSMIRF